MRKHSPGAADRTWYVVDDHTVVQSWFNPERERTEYVQYATTKRVAADRLRTADADFDRAYRTGEWLLVAISALALVATIGIVAGALFLPATLESQSKLPIRVLVASAVVLLVDWAVFLVFWRWRRLVQRQFVADLGFDQRTGHTLKNHQVEKLLHAPGTVTVRPTA